MLGWDSRACVLAIAPNAWSKGNGTEDRNSGIFPTWPNSAFQPVVMTEMTDIANAYDGSLGVISFEGGLFGNQGYLSSTYGFSLTNSSDLTVEAKIRHYDLLDQAILAQWEDVNNSIQFQVNSSHRPAMVIEVGGVTETAAAGAGNELSNAVTYTIHYVKKGQDLFLFLNGAPVTGYATRDTYDRGDKTFANSARVGVLDTATNPLVEQVFWLAIYDEALDEETIAKHHRLPLDMGTSGYSNGGNMRLVRPETQSTVSVGVGL